jgi:hypothetical protein
MPVPINIAYATTKHPVEWMYYLDLNQKKQGTLSGLTYEFISILQSDTLPNESNTQYLKLVVEFEKEINLKKEIFESFDIQVEKKRFNEITSTILDFKPDKLSFELTYEGGVFFTLKKDHFSFYIQYFFETESDEMEEVLLSIFKGNTKLPSYAGNLEEIVSELENILVSQRLILI